MRYGTCPRNIYISFSHLIKSRTINLQSFAPKDSTKPVLVLCISSSAHPARADISLQCRSAITCVADSVIFYDRRTACSQRSRRRVRNAERSPPVVAERHLASNTLHRFVMLGSFSDGRVGVQPFRYPVSKYAGHS
jgi:hypothetical protein